jgi:hypothetical protein
MEWRLPPQVVPEAVTVAEAVSALVLVGVKLAARLKVAPGFRVMVCCPPSRPGTKVKWESLGAPIANVPAAPPELTRVRMTSGAVAWTSVAGNANDFPPVVEKERVAPLGVPESATEVWAFWGSFVNNSRDPVRVVPAIALESADAVTESTPTLPGAT